MERRTGICLPLAALRTKDCPSCGDFLALKTLADFCSGCGLKIVQLLPVNDTGTQSSPYSGLSAFALHPLYIRLEALPEFSGVLKSSKKFATAYKDFLEDFPATPRFDYDGLFVRKNALLRLLYEWARKRPEWFDTEPQLQKFALQNDWLVEYVIFKVLKDENAQSFWKQWNQFDQSPTRARVSQLWRGKAKKVRNNFYTWLQMRAHEQFKEGSDYLRAKGILLKGDIPILMNEDSADCWAHGENFDSSWRAGSPPDGDNPLGQSWGFPVYNWRRMKADNYSWWKHRVQVASQYYDAFRIDHVLGFFRIWASKENESTAYLGRTLPYVDFSQEELEKLGFSKERIKWLCEPHIPTSLIEDITWNHDEATFFLSQVCDRVKNEELWTFKQQITGDKDILGYVFCEDERKNTAVRQALAKKWRDRALIKTKGSLFIKASGCEMSTAWSTLSEKEKEALNELFCQTGKKENELWRQNALETLGVLVGASSMIPCAEDLGASLEVMPEVLSQLGILSLKVLRWMRLWQDEGQPYVPLKEYPLMSVATTSVHDSSTLRQWWNGEKESVKAFLHLFEPSEDDTGEEGAQDETAEKLPCADEVFSPVAARFVLQKAALCQSVFFINPIQDYLYLDESFYAQDESQERINVPGTVSSFNWTYRIPVTLEELCENDGLKGAISEIVQIHDNN